MHLMRRLEYVFRAFDLRVTGKWFLLAGSVGIVAGVGAIAFEILSQAVVHFVLSGTTGYVPAHTAGDYAIFEPGATSADFSPWPILAVIAAGGLFSGIFVYSLAPEAEGHGTDAAIDAFHNKRGRIRARIPIIKMIASAVTIGTGGSGGREGPIAQIGGGFGSFLATSLKLTTRDHRILLAAGMGAGVGAIFRAPLAGALFAGEIMYRDADLESDAIMPAAIASVVSFTTFSYWLPPEKRFVPLFGNHLHYQMESFAEMGLLTVMAIVLTLVGILYIKVFYGTRDLFKMLPIYPHFKPMLGAVLAGLAGIGLYYAFDENISALAVLGTGYGTLQAALDPGPGPGIRLLIAVALVKILTTSLTISSGGSGGVFGPSMVIGGCTGAALGQLFHTWWPETVPTPQAYAIVGMAGFFAGCAHAPFSTIIMVSEMTGDYKLLLPTMWVCTLCFLFGQRWSLYEKQVPTRLESPAHRGDFIVDLLEGIKVREVYRRDRLPELVPESASLDEIVHMLARTHQHYFPVVDADGKMVGIFSADDVRSYLYNETIWKLAVARDIMTTKVVSVTPDDDLNSAMRRFTQLNLDELPVMDPQNPGKLLGMLRRKETIAYYNKRLLDHKQSVGD